MSRPQDAVPFEQGYLAQTLTRLFDALEFYAQGGEDGGAVALTALKAYGTRSGGEVRRKVKEDTNAA